MTGKFAQALKAGESWAIKLQLAIEAGQVAEGPVIVSSEEWASIAAETERLVKHIDEIERRMPAKLAERLIYWAREQQIAGPMPGASLAMYDAAEAICSFTYLKMCLPEKLK